MLTNNLLGRWQAKFETKQYLKWTAGLDATPFHPNFFSVFFKRSHSSVSWTLYPDVWNMWKTICEYMNRGVFQYSALWSQQSFGMKRQRMLFMSSSLYRKENQLPLFTGNIISSLLSSGESLFPKLILPPTQTQHRQKSNQNLAEADAMLRKPSSNLRYEETVPVWWGSRVESWLMQTHLGRK